MTRPDAVDTVGVASTRQPPTLEQITTALHASWSRETCDSASAKQWSLDNPSRGQCGTSALIVHDLLGGQLLVHDVFYLDGTRQGWHWSNLLLDGTAVDLTAEQFHADEVLEPPIAVERPPGPLRRSAEQYALLRRRVLAHLEHSDERSPTATTSGAPDLPPSL